MKMATLLLSATVSILGGLIFGYELVIISGALLQLKVEYYLTCFEQEALVSSILIGALLASLIGGVVIDRSGRRTSILASSLVVLAGSTILILSSSFWWLVMGRVTIGFAISISSMACCIYVSEIVHPHQRGMLVSLYETGITVGILFSYAINYLLSSVNEGWKYMFGLAVVPAIVQFISILFLPSKPHKLNLWDREPEKGLIEMEDIDETEVNPEQYDRNYKFLDLFSSKDNMRMRTIVGLGLVLFQQITGQPNVLYYASTIFRSVGFQSNSSAVLASVGLGVVKVLSTLVAMSCADKAGRRILLITGCIVMTLSITGMGLVSFTIKLDTQNDCEFITRLNMSHGMSNSSLMLEPISGMTTPLNTKYSPGQQNFSVINAETFKSAITKNGLSRTWSVDKSLQPSKEDTKQIQQTAARTSLFNYDTVLNWISLLSLMAFVSAFSIGFGPMTWLVLSEIYPEEIRGRAFAFCNSFNWAANLLISLTFLDVIDSIGLPWTFLFYGLMGLAAIIFIYLFIPETKGQTLEEIDKQFSSKRLLHGNQMWKRHGWRSLSGPHYQRMGRCSTDSKLF
ncbi:solute carrier family 2, facilitated glucose transporter member 10 [Rhinophrynus dorsalis]